MIKKLLLGFVLIFLSVAPPAYAQKKGLEVYPSFIDVELINPGEEKKLEIYFVNHNSESLNLELVPIDFKQKDEYGGISLIGQEAGTFSYSLSSFLSFESNSLVLAPGEKRKFLVSVKNREDLSPGGHYAAVVAKLVSTGDESESATAIKPSVSSLILLRKVGGERFNLSLSNIDWPKTLFVFSYQSSLVLTFKNEGNVHLTPYGRLDIKDIFGRLIYKAVVNEGSLRVLPETTRRIPVFLTKTALGLPFSVNSISVQGEDSLKKTRYLYKGSFIYVDPAILVLVAVLIYSLKRRAKTQEKMKKKLLIVAVVALLIVLIINFNKENKGTISGNLSKRTQEYVKERKIKGELSWLGVNLNKKGEVEGAKSIQVDRCFSLEIPFSVTEEKNKGECFKIFFTDEPKGTVVVYLRDVDYISIDDDPGVRMRRLDSEKYEEKIKNYNGYEFVIFRVREDSYEKSAFYLADGKLFVLNLIVQTNENLDAEFEQMLSSVKIL